MRNLTPIKESTGTKENEKKEEITEKKENGEAEKKNEHESEEIPTRKLKIQVKR